MKADLPRVTKIVTQLDLRDCPEGIVLRTAEPDQSVEKQFFADWENATTIPGYWGSWRQFCVVREPDTGRVVLEHQMKDNGCILTGQTEWTDYTVEAAMRQFLSSSLPNDDDEFNTIAHTGIVFRHQTVRRYYHFCMEGLERFLLCRRKDDQRTILGFCNRPVERSRYYGLRVTVEGRRIRCFVDDELAIEVEDDAYASGRVGWRTNTLSRLATMTVSMREESLSSAHETRDARERERTRRQRQCPQMKLWRELRVGPARLLAVERPSSGNAVIVLSSPLDTASWLFGKPTASSDFWLKAVNLEGRALWQVESPQAIPPGMTVGALNGDGSRIIACVLGERLALLDLASGAPRASAPLPGCGPYCIGRKPLFRGSKCSPGKLYLLQLRPPPAPKSVLLMEDSSGGGNTLWAYDHELKLQWTITLHQPGYGHHFGWHDVDGDGCDEILAGYTLLDHDGRILWRVGGCEYFDCYLGGRHPDITHIGKLDGKELGAVIAGGPDGAIFVDLHSGKIRARHRIGHAQLLVVGNFRPDRPGLEVWVCTGWGNFGIMTLFSGTGEELFQCESFRYCCGMRVVRNWAGDGRDLLFPFSDERLLGLWDGAGQVVAPMPAPYDQPRNPLNFLKDFPQALAADACGNGRDEIILMDQETMRIYAPE